MSDAALGGLHGDGDGCVDIFYGNVAGVMSKRDELADAVIGGGDLSSGVLIGIGETQLRSWDVMEDIDGYAWTGHSNDSGDVADRRGSGGIGAWARIDCASALAVIPGDSHRRIWYRIAGCHGVRATFIVMCYAPVDLVAAERGAAARIRRGEDGNAHVGVAEAWWRELTEEVLSFRARGDVIVMGDLNARIGERVGDTVTTRNGRRLLAFVATCDMAIVNGTELCSGGQWTWRSNAKRSVIDYVLVSSEALHRVRAMRVLDLDVGSDHAFLKLEWKAHFTNGSVNAPRTAHGGVLRESLGSEAPAPHGSRRNSPRGDTAASRLIWRVPRNPAEWQPFGIAIGESMAPWLDVHESGRDSAHGAHLSPVDAANAAWSDWRSAVESAMHASLGTRRVYRESHAQHRVTRLPAGIRSVLQSRRKAWSDWRSAESLGRDNPEFGRLWLRYRSARRAASRLLRSHARARTSRTWDRIDGLRDSEAWRFWRIVRDLRVGKRSPIPETVHRADGSRTADAAETRQHFARHFERVSSPGGAAIAANRWDEKHCLFVEGKVAAALSDASLATDSGEDYNGDIAFDEIAHALKSLRGGRAAGPDDIHTEMLLYGGESMHRSLWALFALLWRLRVVPDEWLRATITPLLKNGSLARDSVTNYRGISLMSCVAKLYERVLLNRLTARLDDQRTLPEEQGGFRDGRSAIDQVFILTEATAQRAEDDLPTFVAFLDISKAYDTVWRDGMFYSLAEAGVRGRLLHCIRGFYRDVRSCVMMNGHRSKWFTSLLGVRQGSVLSPALFNVFINGLVRYLNELGFGVDIGGDRFRGGNGRRNGSRRLAILLFADDIALLACSEHELRAMLVAVEEYARRWRFAFNGDKCEVMVCHESKAHRDDAIANNRDWYIGGHVLKQVEQFKYLGVDTHHALDWKPHLQRVTAKGTQRLPQLWRSGGSFRGMRMSTGRRLAEVIIRTAIEYGSELVCPPPSAFKRTESVQLQAARIITGAEAHTNGDTLLGELGWRPMRDHYSLRQLAFFHRLRTLPVTRLSAWFFRERMRVTAARILWPGEHVSALRLRARADGIVGATVKPRGFCAHIRGVMARFGIEDEWRCDGTTDSGQWRVVCNDVKDAMDNAWRERLNERTKGRWYSPLKRSFGVESYIDEAATGTRRRGAQWKLRMRCLSVPLNAVRFMEDRVASPLCTVCDRGEPEDCAHFLLRCPAYAHLRNRMIAMAAVCVAIPLSGGDRPRVPPPAPLPGGRVDRALRGVDGIVGGGGGVDIGVDQPDLLAWCGIDDGARVTVLLSDERVDTPLKLFLAAAFRIRTEALVGMSDRAVLSSEGLR